MTRGSSTQHRSKSWKPSRGAELVEMALILPLLLILLIGLFWAGRACHIYETITRAAREGARVAIAPSCGTCGNSFPTSSDGAVQAAVNNVLSSSNITAIVNVQQHQTLNLDPVNSDAQWTVIKITSPFQFNLPFTTIGTVNISTQVQMLEEQ